MHSTTAIMNILPTEIQVIRKPLTRTISKTIGVPNSTGKHIKVSRMNQWRDFLDLGRSKDES